MGNTRVLVAGGAGFLGSHLVDALVAAGHEVAILDSLVPQVHGAERAWPAWTVAHGKAHGLGVVGDGFRAVFGDVRERHVVDQLLADFRPQCVVHLAAEVGVGQAEYQIERYVDANVRGTAVLLEAILAANDTVAEAADGIRRLVVAGSMSSYGEGLYQCAAHGPVRPYRSPPDLAAGRWDPRCPHGGCAEPIAPIGTPEWCSLRPTGVYAATKRDQEELALMVAGARGMSTAVVRLWNAYGPRQSLRNPYTGVAATFASRLLGGLAPRVYEDGLQARDLIHVSDVAAALMALVGDQHPRLAARWWAAAPSQGVFNVGTGEPTTVLRIAELACEVIDRQVEYTATRVEQPVRSETEAFERRRAGGAVAAAGDDAFELRPEVTGAWRAGDVRSCIADPAHLVNATGWRPKVRPEDGLRALFAQLRDDPASRIDHDRDAAHRELAERGLVHGAATAAELDADEAAPAASGWEG